MGWGFGGWGVSANGYRALLWGDENVLKLTVVMAAQVYEYTKNHSTIQNCLVCELYSHKAVKM